MFMWHIWCRNFHTGYIWIELIKINAHAAKTTSFRWTIFRQWTFWNKPALYNHTLKLINTLTNIYMYLIIYVNITPLNLCIYTKFLMQCFIIFLYIKYLVISNHQVNWKCPIIISVGVCPYIYKLTFYLSIILYYNIFFPHAHNLCQHSFSKTARMALFPAKIQGT